MDIENCPLCNSINAKANWHSQSYEEKYCKIICSNCGTVCITAKVFDRLTKNKREKQQISHLLNEKHTRDLLTVPKEDIPLQDTQKKYLESKILLITENNNDKQSYLNYPIKTLDQLLSTYPQTVSEKLNRALCNIARMQLYFSSSQYIPCLSNMFANNIDELMYYAKMLINHGLCDQLQFGVIGKSIPYLLLTIEGWQRFEELEKNWQNSTTAFVAMWFSKEYTENYREAVKEAIRQAGYEPKIIDDHDHNNFIMDEVINQINEAKFVIADFTCIPEQPENNSKIPGGVRGGVYFEAGYAKGLGKEVIVTCKGDEDSKKRRHFDIDQLNTLFWSEKDGKLFDCNGNDFIHRLAERIKATVGKGKLYTENI